MSAGDLFADLPGEAPRRPPDPGRSIFVGTSGYSFPDWVGPFYPPGTKPADFLSYYARHFDTVEVNSTYYRVPSPEAIARMERKTPPGFRFMVKLNQAMTHERSLAPALVRDFRAALEPLKAVGKYDGLLAQFPWGFRRTPENEAHLAALRDSLAGEPLFVEFRHASWALPDIPERLRQRRLGFCAVDEPAIAGLMPPVAWVTAEDAYVRFHGRNAANWWGQRPSAVGGAAPDAAAGRPGDRYDYDYRADELREWVGKIRDLANQARRTYLFFNNCHAGHAARSAKLMQELLRQQGLPV